MSTLTTKSPTEFPADKSNFHTPEHYLFRSRRGLDRQTVCEISEMKDEPDWMRRFRLKALDVFQSKPLPTWGGEIELDFQDLYYYVRPTLSQKHSWEEVPEEIKETFERLGIPEAERKFLAGVKAQYESEVVYGSLRKDLERQGVIFSDMESAVKDHPELVRAHLGQLVTIRDNKFAALNSAVWSGGSFLYVPPHTRVEVPLQAYFRINAERMGQFERTLIIVGEGAEVHYVEGCTAPLYTTQSLHAAVVEVVVKRGARCRYTTIQNWANNILNLVTKRATVREAGLMEWVDGNLGSQLTMKYPSTYLLEPEARGEMLSIAFASRGQHLDAGAKMIHCAPRTTSQILSKSVSRGGGRSSYRGLVRVERGAREARSHVVCDALMLDDESRSDTWPVMEVLESNATVEHEARVSRVSEKQLFYLMSRGLSESEASAMIVNGFVEPLVKELPMEYAVEMNRLIGMQLEHSIG